MSKVYLVAHLISYGGDVMLNAYSTKKLAIEAAKDYVDKYNLKQIEIHGKDLGLECLFIWDKINYIYTCQEGTETVEVLELVLDQPIEYIQI
jgi:hypothetical protein